MNPSMPFLILTYRDVADRTRIAARVLVISQSNGHQLIEDINKKLGSWTES
jgi:hypothetical protein